MMRDTVGRVDEDGHLLQEINRLKQSSRRRSDMSPNEDVERSKRELSNDDPLQLLSQDTIQTVPNASRKRHLLPAFALSIYGLLHIIPWVITGILSVKPLNASHWHNEWSAPSIWPCYYIDAVTGSGFDCDGLDEVLRDDQLALNTNWRRAVDLIGSIMAVIAVPLSSAICARAAVVYVQNKPRGFSVSKTLALADRGWWDLIMATELLRRRGRERYLSKFLLIATFISVLGAIVWPLRQILVTEEVNQLVVGASQPSILTHDADITGLSQARSVETIRSTRDAINLGSYWDSQPKLWRTPETMCNSTSIGWMVSCATEEQEDSIITNHSYLPGESSFVSFVLNSANTGLFEGHSFRFNSSIHCTNVTGNEFPRPCAGFSTSSSLASQDDTDDGSDEMEFQICAQGDMRFPWNVTRNRQDIEEEVYLHFNSAAASFLSNEETSTSLTQKCTARTSAGYFLLPNKKNSSFGPLLDEFDLSTSYDPKTVFPPEGTGPANPPADMVLGEAYPIPDISDTPALGPLLTATVSIFGPSTFFSKRANASASTSNAPDQSPEEGCEDTVPFYYLADPNNESPLSHIYRPQDSCASNDPSRYSDDLNNWLGNLFLKRHVSDPTSYAEHLFSIGAFYANQANLAQAALMQKYRRTLLTDPGVDVTVFRVHPAAFGVLSVIIILHLSGLAALSYYAIKHPTWTETLDACAVLRLGSQLSDSRSRESLPLDSDLGR